MEAGWKLLPKRASQMRTRREGREAALRIGACQHDADQFGLLLRLKPWRAPIAPAIVKAIGAVRIIADHPVPAATFRLSCSPSLRWPRSAIAPIRCRTSKRCPRSLCGPPLIRWSIQETRRIANRLAQRRIAKPHVIAWSLRRRAHHAAAKQAHLRLKQKLQL
jgi:hypothetical protein